MLMWQSHKKFKKQIAIVFIREFTGFLKNYGNVLEFKDNLSQSVSLTMKKHIFQDLKILVFVTPL